MAFLASIAASILEWILTKGGKALYEAVTAFVEKKRQDAIDKKNVADYKDALDKGLDAERKIAERKMLNGEK